MNYFLSILAGIIQGLTEFLPVSSSGHLVIFHQLFNFDLADNVLFDVVLHLGTLVALLLVFYKDIEKIIRGFVSSLSNNYNQHLAWLVIIGTIPAALVGFFFESIIATYFRSIYVVAGALIIVAILFFIFEKYSKRQKDVSQMSKVDALVVGLAQILAFIPGASRSGITIIASMGRGLKRAEAARFSFIMAMPIIFGAGLKKVFGINHTADINIILLLLGFVSSLVSGYLVIRFLLNFFNNHSLNIFAWYRLIIGFLILIWWAFFLGV
jgi:undecaprenyl-diphosphatase